MAIRRRTPTPSRGDTTVQAPAKGAAADETTGEFAAEKLSPTRLQASFSYGREDAASFVGMGDSLRSNLSEALSDGLDRQILIGANGLLEGGNLAHVAADARTTYQGYREKLAYDHVDGRFASSPGDLRVVVGSATYGDIANSYGTDIGLPSALGRADYAVCPGRLAGFRACPGRHGRPPAICGCPARDASRCGRARLGGRHHHSR